MQRPVSKTTTFTVSLCLWDVLYFIYQQCTLYICMYIADEVIL